ncbi:MAG: rod shape-determining protein RodA [Chromatiales bacterium]|jgi:rod shape determining protein RodA|nr:rod shape-determining protein RodA [Chromatiales bacterium]MDX9767978.1 rod shape-determining protein RodA [Ectothiorhodospiraceae bacterium]
MFDGETPRETLGRAVARLLHLDFALLGGLLLLAAIGLTILYSASGEESAMLLRQLVRLGAAFAVMVLLANLPMQSLRLWAPWVYGAGVLLLLLVLLVGDIGKGAQRWLDLGVIRFQPSELMKLAVPLMLAWYFAEKPLPPAFRHLAVAAVVLLLPVALIVKQPDLGTALLVASAGLFVIFLAGMGWRYIVGLLVLAAATAPVAWHYLHDYQRRRVLTLLDPERDPLGAGYHIIQSKIAVGSGGLYGKGWLNGTQSQLEFLPERSTDFIFAVFTEEFGLLGALLLIAVYLFIIFRGLYIAVRAQDTFARLLAGSLSLTFFVYVFVNMGMVSGILPVVGVPLPLVSYGGTSMVTLMAAFGILMSVNSHRRLISK